MKKSFNNKWLSGMLLLSVLLMSITGCKKFLDVQNQGAYNEGDYPFPEGASPFDEFVFAIYNDLRGYNVHVDGFVVATSIRSDDADKGSTPSDGGSDVITMDNFPVLPNNGRCNALWTGYLNLVNQCNYALYQVDTVSKLKEVDPVIKAQAEAEARFVRGYSYFMLVRLFGRVPILDEYYADNVGRLNQPQSEPSAIYQFIEADLEYAAANLPASWDPKFVGRITSGAANGILAKVYLTQQKWAQAMAKSNLVMTSGQYDLSTPYTRIFGEDGENSKESVWEIQGTADQNFQTARGIQYASLQGVRGAGDWNFGWGWNTPSVQLEQAYEDDDPRKDRTILYTSTGSNIGYTIYGEATPVGLPNPRYNQKVLTQASWRAKVGARSGYWMNVRILRYADVVLMYAEALNETGGDANITQAKAALNSVRARARNGNNSILPDITTNNQEELRKAIQQERRIELAMEHDRFFDIVRWGIADEMMHAAGKNNFSMSRDKLLPIPQTQIDLSNGVLTQNPGY